MVYGGLKGENLMSCGLKKMNCRLHWSLAFVSISLMQICRFIMSCEATDRPSLVTTEQSPFRPSPTGPRPLTHRATPLTHHEDVKLVHAAEGGLHCLPQRH